MSSQPVRPRVVPTCRGIDWGPARAGRLTVAATVLLVAVAPVGVGAADGGEPDHHLLVSELMTGGASASDEFVEVYNPGASALPLEGLEVVYVTASGVTVTRKAAWEAGAPSVPGGGHVLIANEAGVFAGIADVTYANGLAATGGSLALRVQGASVAIDAVGWGTASSTWLEGTPAAAPEPGSSLERLPGGDAGSGQDTHENADDFVLRELPDPQNSTSPPVPAPAPEPSGSPAVTPTIGPTLATTPTVAPTPTPAATAVPTPAGTPVPTAPPPSPIPIADARVLPEGSVVTIRGGALTDSAFTEGGGYVVDASGGIAVLLSDGAFARGEDVTITGEIDERFSQRTLRSTADGVSLGGIAQEPAALAVATGEVGEGLEARLVAIGATVTGAPTVLTTGLAFDLDDGSGAVRVVVADATGIDTDAWTAGTRVELAGVVGQRDSTGTGTAGYRLQPRDPADVLLVQQPALTPSPAPSASAPPGGGPGASPTPGPTASPRPVVSIAEARAAASNTRWRIRGVVTADSGLVDPTTAVIQDESAALVIRLAEEAGVLRRGELVELDGTRSTRSGMLTLRVTQPPVRLATGRPEPPAAARATGAVGEADEARLVTVAGATATAPRGTSAANVYFTLDDGSGPLTIFLFAATGIPSDALVSGAWLEVRGVVGQETSGSQPQRGYRLWPRDAADLRLVAVPPDATGAGGDDRDARTEGATRSPALDALLPGAPPGGAEGVEATLVAGAWLELGLAGVLWDGTRAVGITAGPDAQRLVEAVTARAAPPGAVRLTTEPAVGVVADLNLPLLRFGAGASLEPLAAPPADPLSELPESTDAAWVRLAGRLARSAGGALRLETASGAVEIDLRCDRGEERLPGPRHAVTAEGLAGGGFPRLVVPCGGLTPAPTLTAAAAGPLSPVPDEPTGGSSPSAEATQDGGRLAPAVLLLAAGTLGASVAGTVAWRRGVLARLAALPLAGRASEASDEPAASMEDAPRVGRAPHADGDASGAGAQRLQLLALPDDPPGGRGG